MMREVVVLMGPTCKRIYIGTKKTGISPPELLQSRDTAVTYIADAVRSVRS